MIAMNDDLVNQPSQLATLLGLRLLVHALSGLEEEHTANYKFVDARQRSAGVLNRWGDLLSKAKEALPPLLAMEMEKQSGDMITEFYKPLEGQNANIERLALVGKEMEKMIDSLKAAGEKLEEDIRRAGGTYDSDLFSATLQWLDTQHKEELKKSNRLSTPKGPTRG